MGNDLNPTGGTGAGEPSGAAATAGSQAGPDILAQLEAPEAPAQTSAASDPWKDEAFLKTVGSLDFTKAPPDVRAKLEAPFQSHWTKKFQENAEEGRRIAAQRDQLMNVVIEGMKTKGVDPTQGTQDQIREKIEAGEFGEIPHLIQSEVERVTGPIREQAALQKALDTAYRMNPMVKDREQEIAAVIRENPDLQAMAKANGYQFAPYVLSGLAMQMENAQLKASMAESAAKHAAEMKAFGQQVLKAARAEAAGLPVATSKAGTGNSGVRPEGEMTMRQALEKAWVQTGGVLDPLLR